VSRRESFRTDSGPNIRLVGLLQPGEHAAPPGMYTGTYIHIHRRRRLLAWCDQGIKLASSTIKYRLNDDRVGLRYLAN